MSPSRISGSWPVSEATTARPAARYSNALSGEKYASALAGYGATPTCMPASAAGTSSCGIAPSQRTRAPRAAARSSSRARSGPWPMIVRRAPSRPAIASIATSTPCQLLSDPMNATSRSPSLITAGANARVSTPFGATSVVSGADPCARAQSATGSETQATVAASASTRRAAATAPSSSTRVRCTRCSSMSGALTSTTAGAVTRAAVSENSENRSYTRSQPSAAMRSAISCAARDTARSRSAAPPRPTGTVTTRAAPRRSAFDRVAYTVTSSPRRWNARTICCTCTDAPFEPSTGIPGSAHT